MTNYDPAQHGKNIGPAFQNPPDPDEEEARERREHEYDDDDLRDAEILRRG